jgi:hypothetical protein
MRIVKTQNFVAIAGRGQNSIALNAAEFYFPSDQDGRTSNVQCRRLDFTRYQDHEKSQNKAFRLSVLLPWQNIMLF